MTTYNTGSAALDSARMRLGWSISISVVALIAQISKDTLAEDGVLTSVPFKRKPLRRIPPPRNWPRPSNRPASASVDVPFAV